MTVSRRALLLGAASTAALAACSRGPAPIMTPTQTPSGPAATQLQQVMEAYRANTDLLGLSVKDLRTGGEFSWQGDWVSQSASIAKVVIVLLALVQAREAGTELSFEDYGRASQAIINSANDPSDELWEKVGGKDAYTALATELGLGNTHGDDRSEFWSWTNTTADDQRHLADLLVNGHPAIHVEDRLYLLDLMSRTNPDHTWGVGHDRGRDVRVSMKNGWVQFKSIDNLWGVNSMGHVRGKGRDYVAAIMTRMPTFDEGRALVDAIGADVFRVLEAELPAP